MTSDKWTRRYYRFTVRDARTNEIVDTETMTTYNRRYNAYARQDALVSSPIITGVFISRQEACTYLRMARRRERAQTAENRLYIISHGTETKFD